MNILILAYLLINLFAFILYVVTMIDLPFDSMIFVYPWIHEELELEEINLVGKIIAYTVITLIFLPAFATYFILGTAIIILCILLSNVISLFRFLFKKRGI